MRRREFVTFVGGAVLCPLAAHAQQLERMRLIGVLMGYAETDSEGQAQIAAFRDGLQKLGWTEGRNTRIDTRWATSTDAARCNDSRRNSWRYSPTSFLRAAHPPRPHCCNKRAPSPSFSRQSAIRFTVAYRVEITSLAARYRLPTIYPFRLFAEVGGLLSYGVDLADNFRRAATYVDRILKGEKPSELPVQAPTKYELIINLKTAKALGLTIPHNLLLLADEVID